MTPLKVHRERDGQVIRLVLARPKPNVLDAEMIGALRDAIRAIHPDGALKLVILDHEGPHFSFGASVPEHLPGRVVQMLDSFHNLLRELEGLGVPTAAIVRGHCLGGGLELALATGRIFCDRTARFAAPEVKLAVFPPAASVLLPLRVNTAVAADLVTTGVTLDGESALRVGLVESCTDDAKAACDAWFEAGLAPHSAVAVREGWRAVRRPAVRALYDDLAAVEHQYLADLMSHRDPIEGLTAFVDRRTPVWEHA